MANKTIPLPPRHLKPTTRKWFQGIAQTYELEAHHVKLLVMAAEAWDRAQAAGAIINQQGMTFLDKHGQPRARPEIAFERDSRLAFARMLRELDLDTEMPPAASRPPALRSNRRA